MTMTRGLWLSLAFFGCSWACSPNGAADDGQAATGGTSSMTGGAQSSGGTSDTGGGGGLVGGGGAPGAGGIGNTGGTIAVGTGGTGGGVFVGDLALPVSPYIVVDQFGYLPDGEKLATIRDPDTGFDADEEFVPGATYALVDATTGFSVTTSAPTIWNDGAVDEVSGDRAWTFTFSTITTPGEYFVMDLDRQVRSYSFSISEDVYRTVLKHAVRVMYYQRSGPAKTAEHAGEGWTDGPSFVGPGQDLECRLYSDMNNAATERDLSGGWFDAGDLNKYTIWTAGYVQNLLRAFVENPEVWTDDYDIPESDNGIADILDEALFGLEFLGRLQESNGSVLSIVGAQGASPPSAATDPCRYGPASTSATLASAAAFATAARVLPEAGVASLDVIIDDSLERAESAWSWALDNPQVIFRNNEGDASGLGAGQQETDEYGRLAHKLDAAAQLYAVTGDEEYRTFFDANYSQLNLIATNGSVEPWHILGQDAALDYTNAEGATPSTVTAIHQAYLSGIQGNANLGAIAQDPYRTPLPAYTWGSNVIKAHMGNNFMNVISYGLDATAMDQMRKAAEGYVHYLHGVNPFSLVYLSNMYDYEAENCVNEIYHSWFADGSALWDRVGESTYGPPPGFLAGGPNPSYACGDTNYPECDPALLTPPLGQPPAKSYKDFNAGWPEGSWSISEPSNGYQVAYIRLLSKFVK